MEHFLDLSGEGSPGSAGGGMGNSVESWTFGDMGSSVAVATAAGAGCGGAELAAAPWLFSERGEHDLMRLRSPLFLDSRFFSAPSWEWVELRRLERLIGEEVFTD